MLRIYFLQQWFNLSDPGAEEALYDSLTMRRFVDIELDCKPVLGETMLCKFRHLLERRDLGSALFERVHEHLERRGLKLSDGTIVDATIIHAPSSMKRAATARDLGMHQTRKGRGQPVVCRNEGAYRRGQPQHADPLRGGDGGQHLGCDGTAQSAAR